MSGGHPDDDDAATAVLADGALLSRITRFQCGYPELVIALIRGAAKRSFELRLHVAQKREGTLPRLAAVAGDVQALRLLFDLKTQAQYRDDPMLQFVDVMRTAVLCRNTEILECFLELKNRDPAWQHWEPNLMSSAYIGGSIRVLEWLYEHLPRDQCEVQEGSMEMAMRSASVDVIRWFIEHGYEVTSRAADAGASARNLDVLTYLYENTDVCCSPSAVWESVAVGQWEMVKLLLTKEQTEETYARTINAAARRGLLAMVKYFVERGIGVDSPTVIDEAAHGGHLNVVQYLHEYLPRRSASSAAAKTEGLSEKDTSAPSSEDSTVSTGCTSNALKLAAMSRHLNVVEFLCKHRSEGDIGAVMVSAASKGYLDVVKLLLEHRRSEDAVFPAVRVAARARQMNVVKFLCESQEQQEQTSLRFLAQATADGAHWLVNAVAEFSTVVELTRVRDFAVEQHREQSREYLRILEQFIYDKTLASAPDGGYA